MKKFCLDENAELQLKKMDLAFADRLNSSFKKLLEIIVNSNNNNIKIIVRKNL